MPQICARVPLPEKQEWSAFGKQKCVSTDPAMLWPVPCCHSNMTARLARATLMSSPHASYTDGTSHLSEGLREAAETELQRPEPGEPAAGCCARAAAALYLPCSASSASAVPRQDSPVSNLPR